MIPRYTKVLILLTLSIYTYMCMKGLFTKFTNSCLPVRFFSSSVSTVLIHDVLLSAKAETCCQQNVRQALPTKKSLKLLFLQTDTGKHFVSQRNVSTS